MEYLILFTSYWFVPLIATKYLLPTDDLLMMSTFQSIMIPYLMTAVIILALTIVINMIRTIRTCPIEKKKPRSWGFSGGIKLGLSAAIFATVMYIIVESYPGLLSPFIAISILPQSTEIGQGFYVALGAFLGYWMGRPLIGLCSTS